jgi:23S rRNA (cytidine1920-2'-O)/16S rRNA (cytidine1409-2'-O)-methyltransferase
MARLGYNKNAKGVSLGYITETGSRKLKTDNRKPKTRLDQLLVARGLAPSRAQAQALILAGRVQVEGVEQPKAGAIVWEAVRVTLKEPSPFVSRGGEKLAGALDHFQVNPAGKVALDTGASTGGFTHCLLTRGARKVYAVDVGYGQLDAGLRNDPRVAVLERVNIRHLPQTAIPEPIDLATLDLSFISLTLVLPKILELLRPGGAILALVKPQFEVGKGQVGKGGVVRDPQLQQAAVARVAAAAAALGLQVSPAFPSPLKGPKGNQEYFLHLIRPGEPSDALDKPPD